MNGSDRSTTCSNQLTIITLMKTGVNSLYYYDFLARLTPYQKAACSNHVGVKCKFSRPATCTVYYRRTSSTKLNRGVIGAEWLVGLGV